MFWAPSLVSVFAVKLFHKQHTCLTTIYQSQKSGFGKLQEGKVMSKAVELMLEKPEYDRMKSKSCYICEGFISKLFYCI